MVLLTVAHLMSALHRSELLLVLVRHILNCMCYPSCPGVLYRCRLYRPLYLYPVHAAAASAAPRCVRQRQQ
jgi:hypothetical protein